MKSLSVLLPLALAACSYDYIIDPDGASSSTGTTTTTTTSTATTGPGGSPGSGGAGAGDEGGGGASSVTTSSGGGGAGGTGGEGGSEDGGGGAGGGGVECVIVDDCPQPQGECQVATCDDDGTGRLVCGLADRPDGTAVGEQTEGDCKHRACIGGVATDDVPTDDPPANIDCMTYTCDGAGTAVPAPVAVDTPCGDGSLECDGAGSCVGCTDATDCPAPAACRVAVCGGGGVCSDAAAPDAPYDGLAANDCKERVCSGGVLTTIADGSDLPLADANVCTTAACSGTQPVQTPLNSTYDGNGASDCKRRDCVNGVLTTVADAGDVPVSDGLPCTLEQCSGQTAVHTPYAAGSVVSGCNGVCQTGSYAGQCGYSLYSRPFPSAGSWTRQALSAVWNHANAPPPSNILVAEETTDGARIMVIRSNGTYYQYSGGTWQAPVAATSVFSQLPSTVVSAMSVANVFGDELIFFTTSEATPRTAQYVLTNGVGSPSLTLAPTTMNDDTATDPNAAPQHDTTMNWAVGEMRGEYDARDDAAVVWKSLANVVYQFWGGTGGTYYAAAPVSEAASPFGLNGAGGAPASGTIVAGFYRNSTNTVYFIAP